MGYIRKKIYIRDAIPRDLMQYEYIDNKKTDAKIAEKYGFHKETVRSYRQSLGITRYTDSTVHEKFLTDEQRQLIYGSILGDAHITKLGTVEIGHAKKQYSYVHWLSHKLQSVLTEAGLKQNKRGFFRFRLKTLDTLKLLREELYPNGTKIVTRNFLDKLTPLSLSIWFCDDAFLDNGSNYHLCTQGFSDIDRACIEKYFIEKWGIYTYTKSYYNKKYKKYYTQTVFDKENSIKFTDLIKFHMIPSMLYKLLKTERDHIIYLAGGMQASPDGGIKWRRNLKSLLNQKGYYCIDPTKEENYLYLDENWQNPEKDFNKFQINFRRIIDNDLNFVRNSGIIVCLYDQFIGGGSFHELGEAYLKNKEIYLLNLNKKPLKELSWWALGCCTKVFSSIEDLIKGLPDISTRPEYIQYQNTLRSEEFLKRNLSKTI